MGQEVGDVGWVGVGGGVFCWCCWWWWCGRVAARKVGEEFKGSERDGRADFGCAELLEEADAGGLFLLGEKLETAGFGFGWWCRWC